MYVPLCDLRSIFNKQTGTTKIITGFYLPAVVCFSYCCCCCCYCDCFFYCFAVVSFFSITFFCLLFESFLLAVVVVAFKCFFFLTASFDLSVAYSALFVSFTHRHSPSQSRKRRHFDYTLYFVTLTFRIIGGLAESSDGGVSRRFSSDASPDLAATEARLPQSMRFYATALLFNFLYFCFCFIYNNFTI